jgi:hypothetical protein
MPVMDGWRFRGEQQRLQDGELVSTAVVILSALSDAPFHAEWQAPPIDPKPIDNRMVAVIRADCAQK